MPFIRIREEEKTKASEDVSSCESSL